MPYSFVGCFQTEEGKATEEEENREGAGEREERELTTMTIIDSVRRRATMTIINGVLQYYYKYGSTHDSL